MNGASNQRGALEADMLLEFHRLSLKVASIVKAYAASTAIGSSDCEALLVFWQAHIRGETLSASEVAARLNLTRAGATYLIDRLEEKGYISRKPDPNDRRRTLLELSESGCGVGCGFSGAESATKASVFPGHTHGEGKRFLTTRTDAEVELFISMLREIIDELPAR